MLPSIQHDCEIPEITLFPDDRVNMIYTMKINVHWGANKAEIVQVMIDAAAAKAFEFVEAVTYAEPPPVGAPE